MRGQQHLDPFRTEFSDDLRDTITFYDALYVALAAVLNVPLLTADIRLSKAPGLSCLVMLISSRS